MYHVRIAVLQDYVDCRARLTYIKGSWCHMKKCKLFYSRVYEISIVEIWTSLCVKLVNNVHQQHHTLSTKFQIRSHGTASVTVFLCSILFLSPVYMSMSTSLFRSMLSLCHFQCQKSLWLGEFMLKLVRLH